MKRTKQQKEKFNQGITLVALVVTIVVLLILAGVSLNLVLGENGIISKAREASTKTVQAQQNSEIEMNLLEQELANATKEPDPAEGVKIPTGFYYVGGTKTSGIVISDNVNDKDKYKNKAVVGTDLLGNQYVWIPCTTDSTSSKLQYARTEWGVEADGDDNSRAIKDELTLTDASVTYSDADTANGINADVSKEIVAQIKAEKASVAQYGGYYIGRYEVGRNSDTAVVKYNQTPYASITWSTAYGLAKKIITNSEVNSYLCSSYAWDTAVNFIQNNSTAKNYATSIEGFNGNWNPQAVNDPLERYKSSGTLILIPKIEDYIKYTYQVLVKIPRVEKFNIGSEIKTSSLRMLEYAHYLNKDRQNAYSYLNKIDALISYNRSMVRILNDEKSITKKNYETCISKLAEIGRMVGGLIKANPDVRKSPNE